MNESPKLPDDSKEQKLVAGLAAGLAEYHGENVNIACTVKAANILSGVSGFGDRFKGLQPIKMVRLSSKRKVHEDKHDDVA